MGFDAFDSMHAAEKLLSKRVESHALDAIDQQSPSSGEADPEAARRLHDDAANTEAEGHPSAGQGTDLHLHGARLSGGALADECRIVHLRAFRLPEDEAPETRRRRHFASASMRRRARH